MVNGVCVDAAPTLAKEGIDPVVLEAKEGLALVNGTDGMLGMLAVACHDAARLVTIADITAAMSIEALLGTDAVFDADLVGLRPHAGQARSAANLRRMLEGSPIVASHRVGDSRVQDAYSLRCVPQVHGAVRDALAHVEAVCAAELHAAIDNPVVLPRRAGELERQLSRRAAGLRRRLPGDRPGGPVVDGRATRRPDARSGSLPRPSALPRRHAGGGLGTHDRPVHRGGVGGRKPPARDAGQRRVHPDVGDAGGPRLHGMGGGAQAADRDREPRARARHRVRGRCPRH